jgi:hypothetical protein
MYLVKLGGNEIKRGFNISEMKAIKLSDIKNMIFHKEERIY